jgi:hypothetical protein
MTVFPNARIHFISSAHQRDSQCDQRALAARWFQVHTSRAHPGAPELSGHGRTYINALSRFLSHLSLLSRRHQIFRTGPGASVVFHNPDNAYNSCGRYRAVDTRYSIPGSTKRFHKTPQDCTVDAAALVVCLGNRRNCLPDALPDLSFVTISKTETRTE